MLRSSEDFSDLFNLFVFVEKFEKDVLLFFPPANIGVDVGAIN